MDMPSVENTLTSDGVEISKEHDVLLHEEQQVAKRISRVSKLRDMFQNGIIRPIEEIDNVVPFEESLPECDRHPDIPRFPRSFPGSPPLSALRAHRMNLAARNNPSLLPKDCSRTPTPVSVSQQSPPICPPKPRHLVVDKASTKHGSPGTSPTAISPPSSAAANITDKDYCLKSCIQHFENGCSKPTQRLSNGATSCVPVVTASTKVTLGNDATGAKLLSADPDTFVPREVAASASITPTTCAVASTPGISPSSSLAGDPSVPVTEIDSLHDSPPPNTSDLNSSTYATPIGRLGSWKGSVQRSRDEDRQPNAFQSIGSAVGDGVSEVARLQHAESVAVATPDEEDEDRRFTLGSQEGDLGSEEAGTVGTVQPTLPVPNRLHVVAVDSDGIHILEDGNFFYADRRVHHGDEGQEAIDRFSTGAPVEEENGGSGLDDRARLRLADTDGEDDEGEDGEKKPRVRFSTEPTLVYSTYSMSEYNRRNEDIDPLGASAEYELEKQLEHMEMVHVDLKKGPQGLGFSILGLGVDQFGADQKLGIFIKLLTPGGAAESDGRIQIYDQIVEVDGVSLVGVTSEFAASTLRGTQDVVHFVVAREKDPSNSRVAKLLRQQEEMHSLLEEDGNPDSECDDEYEEENRNGRAPGDRMNDDPDTVDSFLPREDSYETLHKLAAEEDKVPSLDGESGRPVEFTTNQPVFESTRLSDHSYSAGLAASVPSLSPLGQSALARTNPTTPGTSPPRSALKGTATAASTQRRGEAIGQLISSAAKEVKQSFPSDDAVDMADRVTWYLASSLHDCQGIVAKQRGQLRNMEQRLTAQEAAADEAIERLCLQCRQTESELGRLAEQLKRQQDHYLLLTSHCPPLSPREGQREEVQHGSVNSSRASLSNENSQFTSVKSNGDAVQPGVMNDKPLTSATTAAEVEQNGSTHLPADSPSNRSPPWFPVSPRKSQSLGEVSTPSARSPRPSQPVESWVSALEKSSSTSETLGCDGHPPLPMYLQQGQARLRMLTTGGLAHRRPPTQIVVAPPLCLFPTADNMLGSSTKTSHSPPLIEAVAEGNSFAPACADPSTAPLAKRPTDPRPLPVSFMHRKPPRSGQPALSPIERPKIASDCELNQSGRGGGLAKMTPRGVSSAERLQCSSPTDSQASSSGVFSNLSPGGSPVRRRVRLIQSPVQTDRPQPIRTPGHPTPLQLQQQHWFSQRSTPTKSASSTPPS